MAGDESNDTKLKVEDRRTSTVGTEGSQEDKDSPKEPESGPGPEASDGDQPMSDKFPPVDFSTFLFSLFSSALIQLGEMADPISGKQEKNLDSASQTIELFAILQEKTKGNLTEEEEKFLKNASAELKWKYLDAVKEKG